MVLYTSLFKIINCCKEKEHGKNRTIFFLHSSSSRKREESRVDEDDNDGALKETGRRKDGNKNKRPKGKGEVKQEELTEESATKLPRC